MTHAEQSLIQRKLEWAAEHRMLSREMQRIQRRMEELEAILEAFK